MRRGKEIRCRAWKRINREDRESGVIKERVNRDDIKGGVNGMMENREGLGKMVVEIHRRDRELGKREKRKQKRVRVNRKKGSGLQEK